VPADAPFGLPVAGPVTLGAEGAFDLRPANPGTFLARLGSPDGSLRLLDPVEVPEGETPWHLDLSLGRVEGTVAAAAGEWACVWEGERGRWAFAGIRPDAEGRFVIPAMPAGRARLVLLDPAARPREPDPRRWPAKREFDVPAGGTATVE
jgi:hypothetical protein